MDQNLDLGGTYVVYAGYTWLLDVEGQTEAIQLVQTYHEHLLYG